MNPPQNTKTSNNLNLKDQQYSEKLELLVQQSYNITIPALYFENISPEGLVFDENDLKNFFSINGKVIDFIIKGKIAIVLYKNFIEAEISRRFLMKDSFYKDNLKNNFVIRWFDYEKDMNIIPPEHEIKFEKIHQKNESNIINNNKKDFLDIMHNANGNKLSNGINGNNINNNNNNINNNININLNNLNQNNQNHLNTNINQSQNQNINNIFISPNIINQYNQIKMNQRIQMNNLQSNMQQINNYGMQNMVMPPPNNLSMFMNQNLGGMNNIMGMPINNHHYNLNQKQFNQNIEEKSYGKYTCKYEILIPNDKEFQVARRLIGSKGYNMKKILTECKINNNNDNIKLRLRGRGSGYKEGPQNKESDEPLHLCISAKNQEEMKKACLKVDELLNKIYDEYKKFCLKNNITPVAPQLAKRIDCGNSLHKSTNI